MRVTALKRHPRRERVRVFVDGGDAPVAELALELAAAGRLHVGCELTAEELARLQREDEVFRARDAALSLLSHRARSRVELRRRLERKELSAGAIEQAMAWLDERGYLDDDAFADAFIRDRLRLRPRGRVGLVQELRRKGIGRDVAEAAIDRVLGAEDVDEGALAVRAAEGWGRRNGRILDAARASRENAAAARRRLYGHLARRGFAPDAIRRALDHVLGD